jgi:hypothetical protein
MDLPVYCDGPETKSFPVTEAIESRFIRLRQTDQAAGGAKYLFLLALEFFGVLSEAPPSTPGPQTSEAPSSKSQQQASKPPPISTPHPTPSTPPSTAKPPRQTSKPQQQTSEPPPTPKPQHDASKPHASPSVKDRQKSASPGSSRAGGIECLMKEEESKDGIIAYLTQKYKGNVHEKGIVKISSKSIYSDRPRWAVKHVVDLKDEMFFLSEAGVDDQWICWDFGDMRVIVTHYTIEACLIHSWVIEGSIDGENWNQIDSRPFVPRSHFPKRTWRTFEMNLPVYCDGPETKSFPVTEAIESRFIRLRQTDTNSGGFKYLLVLALEFFGTLLE